MGYVCPVCEEPQLDAEHLANHVAFTAILRGGDHEEWLAEHAPTWEKQDPATLGTAVAEYAESVSIDHPDDASEERRDRPDAQRDQRARPNERTAELPGEQLSNEDRAVFEKARELTRQMLGDPAEQAGNREPRQAESEWDEDVAAEQRGKLRDGENSDVDRSDSEKE